MKISSIATMRNVVAKRHFMFDVDGTLHRFPGQVSPLFHFTPKGVGSMSSIEAVSKAIEKTYPQLFPPALGKGEAQLDAIRTFFKVLHDDENTTLSIHTNNHMLSVLAFLKYCLKIPLEWFDFGSSTFRNQDKIEGLKSVVEKSGDTQLYYFDDSLDDINDFLYSQEFQRESQREVNIIHCLDGIRCLPMLLSDMQVTSEEDLTTFLEKNKM